MREDGFPEGFLWGVASASYQIEGAVAEDGRGLSVWDTFSQTPGKVKHGDTGTVACDHYHRYRDDIQLMKGLGVRAYRLSVAWPRVVPDGNGPLNPKGLDFYSCLIDTLLEAGIEPWVTCYHWDMPEATYRQHRGWHGRQTAYDFARYAGLVAHALGDRVTHWFTVNEMLCYTALGYGLGIHAPGERVTRAELNRLSHNALLGHGLAVDAIRAAAPRPVRVGLAENPFCMVPVISDAPHTAAARAAFRAKNGGLTVPVLTGAYDPLWLAAQGADAPLFTDRELRQIARPLDFMALNIYSGYFVRPQPSAPGGFEELDFPGHYPQYNILWLRHLPDALYWGLRLTHELSGGLDLYISENGCCASEEPTPAGEVLDTDRVQYLRDYLRAAERAVRDGLPLKGYFHWTLMDNFEWAEGYAKRFGLYRVDYSTQARTPKISARWYAEAIRRNAVV